jgi:hypothetical protein
MPWSATSLEEVAGPRSFRDGSRAASAAAAGPVVGHRRVERGDPRRARALGQDAPKRGRPAPLSRRQLRHPLVAADIAGIVDQIPKVGGDVEVAGLSPLADGGRRS